MSAQSEHTVYIDSVLTQNNLRSDYIELKSKQLIADKYNVSLWTIQDRMKRFNIDNISRKIYSCDEDMFSRETEKSFYLAGFIAADGCISITKGNRQNALSIFLSEKDEDHLLMMKDLFRFDGKIHSSIIKNSKRNPIWKDSVNKGFTISSNKICNDLEKFNIVPRKTYSYSFPEWLRTHQLVNHFMRGYVDGDGCIRIANHYKSGILVLSVVSYRKEFLETFKAVIENQCNMKWNNNIGVNKNHFTLTYSGNRQVLTVADFLYKEATIYLPRKYEPILTQRKVVATLDATKVEETNVGRQ